VYRWSEQAVSGVMTCSALKHLYRHILKHGMCDINTDTASAATNHWSYTSGMLRMNNIALL